MPQSAILVYHSLDRSGQLFSTPPETFKTQVETILEAGIPVISLDEVQRNGGGVALTFDDGHRNFLAHAAPLLAQHRLPATLFVVSGYCGGKVEWRSSPLPGSDAELLDWAEIRDLANAGFTIGAHTVSHPSLPKLPEAAVEQELRRSRLEIEDHLGSPVRAFAYPYGRSNPQIRRLAAREFSLACGTRLALADPKSDSFDLPRIFDFYVRSPYWLSGIQATRGRCYVGARRWISRLREVIAGGA